MRRDLNSIPINVGGVSYATVSTHEDLLLLRDYIIRNSRKQNDARLYDVIGMGRCYADGRVFEIVAVDI
mgnify:CR=1 FL=1